MLSFILNREKEAKSDPVFWIKQMEPGSVECNGYKKCSCDYKRWPKMQECLNWDGRGNLRLKGNIQLIRYPANIKNTMNQVSRYRILKKIKPENIRKR